MKSNQLRWFGYLPVLQAERDLYIHTHPHTYIYIYYKFKPMTSRDFGRSKIRYEHNYKRHKKHGIR